MTETARAKLSIKDRLYSITPWGIVENRMKKSLQNVADAITLDVIGKTRDFHVAEGLQVPRGSSECHRSTSRM